MKGQNLLIIALALGLGFLAYRELSRPIEKAAPFTSLTDFEEKLTYLENAAERLQSQGIGAYVKLHADPSTLDPKTIAAIERAMDRQGWILNRLQ